MRNLHLHATDLINQGVLNTEPGEVSVFSIILTECTKMPPLES